MDNLLPADRSGEGNPDTQAQESSRAEARTTRDTLWGLPCARCKAYYAAQLDTCPVCKFTKRVPQARQDAFDGAFDGVQRVGKRIHVSQHEYHPSKCPE